MTASRIALAALIALSVPAHAQDEEPKGEPSPGEIVAEANKDDWRAVPPDDLLVMTLAPADDGSQREVFIQLLPAPFSASWVANIRTFTRARWFDNISVNRVQDNYVVQWGDVNYDNPEATGPQKSLPGGLLPTSETDYTVAGDAISISTLVADQQRDLALETGAAVADDGTTAVILANGLVDAYAQVALFHDGWPLASNVGAAKEGEPARVWPIHCYGMVGVGRSYSPDAGTGAELYTVIGQAPRHLDRNIALVGRIVEGIEHLSSLPRGKGALGFYEDESKRTPIVSVRLASELPAADRPKFEYLSTDSASFARYADARANRRDPFFIVPAGGADICNIPVPVRRVAD